MTRPLRRLAGTLAAVGLATTGCGSLPDTSDAVDVTASRVPEVVVRTASPTPVPGPASTPASPTPGRVATASPTPSAAPSPTPPPTSTPTPTPAQVVTYGPDGLFRTEDGERRQLLDTPIRLAFDDGRGGAIFQRNDIGIGQVVDGEVVTLAFVQPPARSPTGRCRTAPRGPGCRPWTRRRSHGRPPELAAARSTAAHVR
jgi:hypothetical protein